MIDFTSRLMERKERMMGNSWFGVYITAFFLLFLSVYFEKKEAEKSVLPDVSLEFNDKCLDKPVFKERERRGTEKIYYVERGDSIEKIARKFKILPFQLRQSNSLMLGVVIHPGDKLVIPRPEWPSYVGRASWYGPGFHGKPRADTKIYNQDEILVAHRNLPLGIRVKITNLKNGKSIVAPVADRGPYHKKNGRYDREVDLSKGAAESLDAIKAGVVPVFIEPLS